MSHLLALLSCAAGFAGLAFATRRQQRDIFGGSLPSRTTAGLRLAGACALLLALAILVVSFGWSLGLVMFSGHTSLAAGAVFCALILQARMDARPARR